MATRSQQRMKSSMVSMVVSIRELFSTASPAGGGWIEPAEREDTARPFYMQLGAAKGQQIEKENRTEFSLFDRFVD